MKQQKFKTALIVLIAGVVTLLVILLSYRLLNAPDDASHISLPDYTAVIPQDELPDETEEPFAKVTTDNALQVMKTMTALDAYYQALTIDIYWANGSKQQTVELWRKPGAAKAVTSGSDGLAAEHYLQREDSAWLWYEGEAPVELPLSAASIKDLIGIPELDALMNNSRILEADYASLAGSDRSACIYTRWQMEEGYSMTCWISVETGLLIRAIVEENGAMIYCLQQTTVERLLPGDEAYHTAFMLPGEKLEN